MGPGWLDLLLAFLTLTPSGRLLLPEVLPATETVSHEAEVNDISHSPRFNPTMMIQFTITLFRNVLYLLIPVFQSILMLP